MVKKEQHLIYVTPNGRVEHIEDHLSKGRIQHHVDFLFKIPVINSDESNGELMPFIYIDEKGNKHQFKKISHNSPQAIDCVEYEYKAWKERNPNNTIDQWRKNIIDMLNTYTEQTRDKALKLKIGAYINLVDLFVHQEKKEKEKKETNEKYSNVNQRLYALKELCPELIDSLSKLTQAEQKELMQIITNSNGDNILKKLIYKNSPMDVDGEFEDKIDRFKNKISKKKV
jgi:hypothetical protein